MTMKYKAINKSTVLLNIDLHKNIILLESLLWENGLTVIFS